jgi:hypothetical protein
MKQLLIAVLILATSVFAKADLLERMKLEDALKNRIEDAFRLYDPQARALIRFDYKTYSGTLPGTSIEAFGDMNTLNIDSADINRVVIEVFTELDTITPEAKEYVLKAIPIAKNKITVEYKKPKEHIPKELVKPVLDPQSLGVIAQDAISSMMKVMGSLFGATLLVLFGFLFHQNSKKMKEFKLQILLLTAAFSDRASMPLPAAAAATSNKSSYDTGSAGNSKNREALQKLSLNSLKELFADSYWCREDAYASWLWKNLESDQKTQLLHELSFMKDYSLFCVDIRPSELSYHEHPYYLAPRGLLWTSQEDLSTQVRQDFGLWHFLSPMRQQNLPLVLEERLTAVQTKPEAKNSLVEAQSPLRALEAKLSWKDLSSEDEATLLSHPEMVPVAMRENIRSLVWLVQKDEAFIQKALSRYDARSLALAWIGPETLLKKLEAQLPEKKLKLLLNYKEKMAPSRNSDAYASLVAEGFKNEAA